MNESNQTTKPTAHNMKKKVRQPTELKEKTKLAQPLLNNYHVMVNCQKNSS